MYFDQNRASGSDHLRFVFGTSVVVHPIGTATTYGDIARMMSETTRMRHGNPIAIDVTLGRSQRLAGRQGDGRMTAGS
jgi:O6-methylguanine-DNA--protein-cysteine methyltransferase